MSLNEKSILGVMLLSTVIGLPRAAQASGPPSPADSIRQAQDAKGPDFEFDVNCDQDGVGSMSLHLKNYANPNAALSNSPKCLVYGNQNGAISMCRCEDLEEPVIEELTPSQLPDMSDTSSIVKTSDRIKEFCVSKFHSVCGPFAKPIETSCENERGHCRLSIRGDARDGDYNRASTTCGCGQRTAWMLSQRFKEDFVIQETDADAMCTAQLESCQEPNQPVLHDFQAGSADAFHESSVRCLDRSDERSDACVVSLMDGETRANYSCGCSGTPIAGDIHIGQESLASSLFDACDGMLARCKFFDPQEEEESEDGEDTEGDEDIDDGEDTEGDADIVDGEDTEGDAPNDPSLGDIVDSIGCRSASGSDFGLRPPLGLGLFILLGLRRRRVQQR